VSGARLIPGPVEAPPLRVPDWPLPGYRFVPGVNPHPVKHPEGHLHGAHTADPPPEQVERYYLRGLDLFDQHFWWECHEQLEAVWHTAERGSPYFDHVQGIIQLAAACLKHHVAEARAATRLLERARERLDRVVAAEGALAWGVDVPGLLADTQRFLEGGDPPRIRG